MGILLWEYQSLQHLHRCSLLFTGQFFHGFSGTLDQPSPHLCQRSTFQPAYLAALFTITNKKVAAGHDASTMLLYEMSGGFVGLSCLLPFYLRYFPVETIFPDVSDLIYLILLASVCTIGLYLLQIQVLKVVSAFTVNLTYNLEPVYSIILAMLFFHEARELNGAFYIGLGLIVLSVLLQTFAVFLPRPDKAVSS